MPKLVIKQQLPPPSAQEKLARVLQVVLPVLLVAIGLATAVSLYLSRDGGESPAAATSLNMQLPPVYTRQEERLNEMAAEFEKLATNTENYDKHQQLVTRSEAIMQQLAEMDRIVNDLSLIDKDKQTLLSRHQYQKDYWESKLVFHRLRLARFKVNNPAVTQDALREAVGEALEARQSDTVPKVEPAVANSVPAAQVEAVVAPSPQEAAPMADVQSVSAEAPVQKEQAPATENKGETGEHPDPAAAGLPPGVELPPGMCPLFGPGAAACKPGAEDQK
ncbi:MAG: hypothetical protein KJ914_08840 [Gammaproteobacteria bacterium]|nr:hypothetical protein [Gammaproteobacteria bacterium]MBU1723102.1 hypothetical protein [Gammaproteobacteria bacterium]MBU2007403.1 hypothetical protein [Gammaproteobacteria bacterium]